MPQAITPIATNGAAGPETQTNPATVAARDKPVRIPLPHVGLSENVTPSEIVPYKDNAPPPQCGFLKMVDCIQSYDWRKLTLC